MGVSATLRYKQQNASIALFFSFKISLPYQKNRILSFCLLRQPILLLKDIVLKILHHKMEILIKKNANLQIYLKAGNTLIYTGMRY